MTTLILLVLVGLLATLGLLIWLARLVLELARLVLFLVHGQEAS